MNFRKSQYLLVLLSVAIFSPIGRIQAQSTPKLLAHHVPAAVSRNQVRPLGAVPSAQKMNVSIVLPVRNQPQLKSLLKNLYDPSSPDYHHFLSVKEFTDQFGPTAADYRKVVAFAQANGFTVEEAPANRMVVSMSGTSAQVERAFHVAMKNYRHPTENREFFSADREPLLDLNVAVAHIFGLNNFSVPHPLLHRSATPPQPNTVGAGGSGPGGTFLSSDMRSAYYGGRELTGAGQILGLVEFDGYNISDVDLTFSSVGQSYSVPIKNVLTGGAGGGPCQFGVIYVGEPCSDAEQVTDIVQAIGMAPGLSQIRVYIGWIDSEVLNAIAAEGIAKQVSISWGWMPEDPEVAGVFFQEMAAQGQSVFVASGDNGNYTPGLSYPYPAEDPYVTAVGGTNLLTDGAGGAWSSESAWDRSGGGVSPDGLPIPAWQTGMSNSSNGGSATLRNVPDAAMEANIDNYYCDYGQCDIGWLGGTSLAAPRWAAFTALVNQQAAEAGEPPVGFLNPALYAIAAGPSYAGNLHDITIGKNDYEGMCKGSAACNAGPGFDLVTGLGSPTGQALIDALAPPASTGFQISSSVTELTIDPGNSGSATISITKHGGFNGTVNLAVAGLPNDVSSSWGTNPTSGSSVLRLNVAPTAVRGSYSVRVTGTSGSLSAIANFTLAINARGFAIFPSPGSLRIQQGDSASTSIQVAKYAGFNGNVNLAVTSQLPDGVTAAWSANPTGSATTLTLTARDTALVTESRNGFQFPNIPITITGTSGSLSATTTITIAIRNPGIWLAVSPTFVTVARGESATTTVTAVPWGARQDHRYVLNAYDLPSGVNVSFNPSTISAGESSQVTVATDATTPVGNLGPGIQAMPEDNVGNQSDTGIGLVVTAAPQPTASIHFSPAYAVLQQGGSTTVKIDVIGQHGFNGVEGFRIDPPAGITASFSENPASSSSILTLTASASAQPGLSLVYLCHAADANACTPSSLAWGYYDNLWVQVLPAAGFSLASTTSSLSVVAGGSAASTISVTPLHGFTGDVQLAIASTLPPGVTASFSANPTSSSSVLTMAADATVVPGKYVVMVAGSTSGHGAATAIELSVASVTETALAITRSPGAATTLTATVVSSSSPVPQGQVDFCDTVATPCSGTHKLSTAQINGSGKAILKFHPPVGSHSYKAVFLGTPGGSPPMATSASPVADVVVNGSTSTAIHAAGAVGNYSLTAAVTAATSAVTPSGTVSFIDTSNGNAILATAPVAKSSETLTFTTAPGPQTGNGPHSMATADFNGDGIPDLAVTNSASNTVTILLGQGDGTFAATGNNPTTGKSPAGIATADFNGDGIPDLAIANSKGSTVTILLGNGDGTFSASASSPNTADGPSFLAAGDFNKDGKTDLAVVNSSSNGLGSSITILLGNGDGTFIAQPYSPLSGYSLGAVIVGDFNRDGVLDLAVKDEYEPTVKILLGTSDGNFNLFWSIRKPMGGWGEDLATGDFNKDGNPDLAIASSSDNTVTILLGKGDGTFTTSTNLAAGNGAYSVALGDFNGDGNDDLAVSNLSDGTVSVFLGNGDGSFTSAKSSPVKASCASSVVVGDWNGDGIPEPAALDMCGKSVTVLTAILSKTVIASVDGVAVSASGTHAVVAKYSGDGVYSASTSEATSLLGESAAAMPTFSSAPGTYTSAQTVTISDSTPGAAIHYTTDGSTPTTSSMLYTAPLTVSASETIKAIAIASGYSQSAVASAAYTIELPAATPTFSLPPGTYTSAQQVVMSDSTAGVAIYYTEDGSTPTVNSTPYSEAITVASSVTLQAIAIGSGYSRSPVASATYTIDLPVTTPTLTSMTPAYTSAGGSAFTITANGTGFFSGSILNWGNTALSTQLVSTTQLAAQVPASLIASAGTAAITISNPSGRTSSSLQFQVDAGSAGAAPTFSVSSATVSAGATATYPVTLPSSVSEATVSCLNLPAGATCSYSPASSTVTIATSTTTPTGTFQVTAVFCEKQTTSAGYILVPFVLCPLIFFKRKLFTNRIGTFAGLAVLLALSTIAVVGCGAGRGSAPVQQPAPATHQVTSSAVVTLTVK